MAAAKARTRTKTRSRRSKPAAPVAKPLTHVEQAMLAAENGMVPGERQVAPLIAGIRADHVARYRWAALQMRPGSRVIDVGCGIGYGARLMAEGGKLVTALDVDQAAISYARKHYAHSGVTYECAEAGKVVGFAPDSFDHATCFEMIEHVADPRPMLKALRGCVKGMLFASVPNEDVFPHQGNIRFHHRHYTRQQFEELLAECGWKPLHWFGQGGAESAVEPEVNGRTLVVIAEPAAVQQAAAAPAALRTDAAAPEGKHICIVGLGPSAEAYMDLVKRLGGRKKFCDELWTINALGDVLQSDLVIHMDDIRIQEIRAQARPQSNIAAMVEWLRTTTTPVLTSRAHPDYPALREFPLEDVINDLGHVYFNSTAAYAVAYAIHKKARKISCFGFDFTYPNAHDAEQGRACVEFWLGVAWQRGIEVGLPDKTSLMDQVEPMERRIYGYDTLAVTVTAQPNGSARVSMVPRDRLPTAEDIEHRYDHSRPPNPLLRKTA